VEKERPWAAGKFIYTGNEKFLVRGVTYGTFGPNSSGEDWPKPEIVHKDMRLMRELGANALRVYTLPSRRLLDAAAENGLKVLVGIPWAQHVCFADQSRRARAIVHDVRQAVKTLKGHPAVLAAALGNEIPAPIVRWHGRRRVERFLRNLYEEAKQIDPEMLVTYANYPCTEYLDLSFLDLCCFNLFLHREPDFRAYLARLQNIACNRPLVLTEVGIDSLRAGEDKQAEILSWQLRAAYELGVSGAFVFSWTGEEQRGGLPAEDWAFGLVDAERRPKMAFGAVMKAFDQVPVGIADCRLPMAGCQNHNSPPPTSQSQIYNRPSAIGHPQSVDPQSKGWPKVSVIIASHNAQSTLEDCLQSLMQLKYPNFEVIVVDDGSTDATAAIARRFPFRLISIPKGGLSVARNVGLRAATGEIVAYTDSDCRVDPHWLSYLVVPFMNSDVVGAGGPNLVPPDDPWMAHCVARSPGGPMHVLLTDTIAEHIPGCNMAFRKWALEEIDGFNPLYVKAGDDVDVCWRLQARGYQLGFSHSALVWHHHRSRVRAYWRQQVGYGEGEAFLKRKHPDKFDAFGHTHWLGSLYSALPAYRLLTTQRIYQGPWGSAAFPSVFKESNGYLKHLPQSIEWQWVTMATALCSVFSPWFLLVALISFSLTAWRCLANAAATSLRDCPPIDGVPRRLSHLIQRGVIAYLHFVQPLARLRGRLKGLRIADCGLQIAQTSDPPPAIRNPGGAIRGLFGRHVSSYWSMNSTEKEPFLDCLVRKLSLRSVRMKLDNGWQEQWDLTAQGGFFVAARIQAVSENHGERKRLVRVATKLRIRSVPWVAFMVLVAALVYITRSMDRHGLALDLAIFAVSNLLVLWHGVRLLAQVYRASDEVAEEMRMFRVSSFQFPVARNTTVELEPQKRSLKLET
jgi:glycosyltransferase involved in cell wall biosynthesis